MKSYSKGLLYVSHCKMELCFFGYNNERNTRVDYFSFLVLGEAATIHMNPGES